MRERDCELTGDAVMHRRIQDVARRTQLGSERRRYRGNRVGVAHVERVGSAVRGRHERDVGDLGLNGRWDWDGDGDRGYGGLRHWDTCTNNKTVIQFFPFPPKHKVISKCDTRK